MGGQNSVSVGQFLSEQDPEWFDLPLEERDRQMAAAGVSYFERLDYATSTEEFFDALRGKRIMP